MSKEEQVEIPMNKTKMNQVFMISLVLVGIGLLFLINPTMFTTRRINSPTLIFVLGLFSVLFFGLAAVTIFRKLSDKNPGLTINSQGIIDNSSGVSAGQIPWTDIKKIKIAKVMNQQFLMLVVRNPQNYINRVTNPLKRNMMKMNHKIYGSPISISSNALRTNFNDLHKLLTIKMNEYKTTEKVINS
jgi:hypothetical protein